MINVIDCINAFILLLSTEYELVLGRKGVAVTLRILFDKQDSLCSMLIHLYRICTQQMMEMPRYSILKMRQLHFHHLHMSRK